MLCSTARRTAETADGALAGIEAVLDYRPGLYGASPDGVIGEVRAIDDAVGAVMVIGHNPTIHSLAMAMARARARARASGSCPADPVERPPVRTFPTCALAVYRLALGSWRDLAEGTGILVGSFAPPY